MQATKVPQLQHRKPLPPPTTGATNSESTKQLTNPPSSKVPAPLSSTSTAAIRRQPIPTPDEQQLTAALQLKEEKNYAQAVDKLKPLAENAKDLTIKTKAQREVGLMYYYGLGNVAQDYEQAYTYLQQAAAQGDALAQNTLGFMYAQGLGVPKHEAIAVKYFQQAADQKLAAAQCNLGAMYETGRGVPKDDDTANEYFQLAADQGLAFAQYNLGVRYYDKGNYMLALEFFQQAADQQLPEAINWLATHKKNVMSKNVRLKKFSPHEDLNGPPSKANSYYLFRETR